MIIPDKIDNDLTDILGLMPWTSGAIARAFRADGADIPRKCEREQAFVLHWLLTIYAEHGGGWKKAAGLKLQEMRVRAEAKDPTP